MKLDDVPVIAIPNLSVGSDRALVERLASVVTGAGAVVIDIHSDPVHDRSVFTVAGTEADLGASMVALAHAARTAIDLQQQRGVHPRIGSLDVCPFVPLLSERLDRAIAVAHEAAAAMAAEGIPVFLYGKIARRSETRELPALRRGGLEGLIPPDLGPTTIDPASGAVCVGARDVLIAFNVWLSASVQVARSIARRVRGRDGGLSGVRALGFSIGPGVSQVSMNLTEPVRTGIDTAFAAVAAAANEFGAEVIKTEIVGLPPGRFLPKVDAQAARHLLVPSRSLETVLEERFSS